jgi:hypothetical protein
MESNFLIRTGADPSFVALFSVVHNLWNKPSYNTNTILHYDGIYYNPRKARGLY